MSLSDRIREMARRDLTELTDDDHDRYVRAQQVTGCGAIGFVVGTGLTFVDSMVGAAPALVGIVMVVYSQWVVLTLGQRNSKIKFRRLFREATERHNDRMRDLRQVRDMISYQKARVQSGTLDEQTLRNETRQFAAWLDAMFTKLESELTADRDRLDG